MRKSVTNDGAGVPVWLLATRPQDGYAMRLHTNQPVTQPCGRLDDYIDGISHRAGPSIHNSRFESSSSPFLFSLVVSNMLNVQSDL